MGKPPPSKRSCHDELQQVAPISHIDAAATAASVTAGHLRRKGTDRAPTLAAAGAADALLARGASFSASAAATALGQAPAEALTSADSAAAANRARSVAVLGPFTSAVLSPAEERYIALDCEMVGVGTGGVRSALAQVVVVDFAGRVLYEKHVRVRERVTDYRTAVSGVRPEHLTAPGAVDFAEAQRAVAELARGRIIVGHGLRNDMKALMLGHSWRDTRDTAGYRPLCYRNKAGQVRAKRLKHLAEAHLGVAIQTGEHEPAEDARAALALFRKFRREWEARLAAAPAVAAGRADRDADAAAGVAAEGSGGGGGGSGAAKPKDRRRGRGAGEARGGLAARVPQGHPAARS